MMEPSDFKLQIFALELLILNWFCLVCQELFRLLGILRKVTIVDTNFKPISLIFLRSEFRLPLQVLIPDDFMDLLIRDLDDLTRPEEVSINPSIWSIS